MKRFFRITGKKKGSRLTGSPRMAGVGEVLIASLLAFGGLVVAVLVLSLQWTTIQSNEPPRWTYFTLQILAALTLTLIGLYGILRVLWSTGASMERRGAIVSRAREINLLNEVKPVDEDWPGVPVEIAWTLVPGEKLRFQLKQRQKPRWNLIASGVLVIIFLAVASILTAMTWNTFLNGTIDVLGVLLNLALVIASIWSFRIFVRQLLKITGIGPTRIEVSDFPLRCGLSYDLAIIQPGRVRLKMLDVLLRGVEEATFHDGTDLRSEARVVFEQRVFRKRGIDLRQSSTQEFRAQFSIPERAMHSFQAPNNKMTWLLFVVCTARGWPELDRTFPLLVAPNDHRIDERSADANPRSNENGDLP